MAKVRGKVEAIGTPLSAPFSERLSVHYQVRGVVFDRIAHELEAQAVDFWVVDGTGRLLVRTGALTRLVLQEQFPTGAERREEREAFEERFRSVIGDRELAYALVASLDVGEEIVVRGTIGFDSTVDGVARGYRDAFGVPELVEDDEVERIVSDLPELVG